jgi:LCP family protein required for cell wall assembly
LNVHGLPQKQTIMHRYPKKRRPYRRYQPKRDGATTSQETDASASHDVVLSPLIQVPNPADLAPDQSPGRWRRLRDWPVKKIALIGGPLLLVAVLAAFIMPTLLAAHQAYNKIFVPRMPHLHVVLNAQGTPVIAEETQTPGPTPTPNVAGVGPFATPIASSVSLTPTPSVDLPDWDGTSRVNILLLGSDTRGDGEVARSDTLILVTINPETKQVSMLSIPRDLLVTIPDYGRDKINAAYAYGSMNNLTGPGLAAATVEYNFGVTIDYFAEVDTTGLARIIDTLGGVTLDVPTPIKDDEYPGSGNNYLRVDFQTGLQHMDGVRAVQYARTRHDDNDFARGNRQQQLLRALRAQTVGLDLLPKAPDLLNQLADTFRTDLSPKQVLALAKLGSSIPSDDIHSYDLESATTVSFAPGQPYYLIPDWPAIHKILDEMMSR